MKTLRVVALVTLLAGCHLDKLIQGGGGDPPVSNGPVARLAFANRPTGARAGRPLPAVRVALVDSAGRMVPSADTLVRVTLGTNPSGATLSGTDTARAANG